MAFNPETATWETGIYQWETTDPLQGGLGGIDNVPMVQLGNRTKYLKEHVDSLEANPRKYKDIYIVGATTTLVSATHYGSLIVIYGTTGPIILTLPASGILDDNKIISFINKGAYSVTIQKAGSDTVDGSANIVLPGATNWADLVLDFAATNFVVKAANLSPITTTIADKKSIVSMLGVTSTSFTNITDGSTVLSYTTPNDGVTRKYDIKFKCKAVLAESTAPGVSINGQAEFELYNSTASSQLDETSFKLKFDHGSPTTFGYTIDGTIVCMDTITLGPNVTIVSRVKKSAGVGVDLYNAKMLVTEIK
jgi:hypothetical protein